MKPKSSLFRKIFIFSIFIVLFTVCMSYILNIFFVDDFYVARKKKVILEIASEVIKITDEDELDEFIDNARDAEGVDILVVDENFFKIENYNIRRNTNPPAGLIAPKQRNNRYIPRLKIEHDKFYADIIPHTNIRILSYSYNFDGNKTALLSTSLSVMASHKHEMNIFNVITTLIALLISTIIGRIFSKKITKNIGEANIIAKKISVLDFSQKLEIDSEDEIGELSRSINIMSESLESSIENLKSFASNASHELRTPITVINTHAQGLLGGTAKTEKDKISYYKAIAKKSSEMAEIVENLLTISRISSPRIELNFEKVNLLDLIESSREKYEVIELEKDIEWDIQVKNPIIECDPRLFRIAITNIIQNALKYSMEEKEIKIYEENSNICFSNTTNGKISGDISTLWNPFTRGSNAIENAIDGKGLGLSIIKKIVEINGYKCNIKLGDDSFIFMINLGRA